MFWSYLIFTIQKRNKRDETWSGLFLSSPHLSWEAEPRKGCMSINDHAHLTNCDLSIISSTYASFPIRFSAQIAVSP